MNYNEAYDEVHTGPGRLVIPVIAEPHVCPHPAAVSKTGVLLLPVGSEFVCECDLKYTLEVSDQQAWWGAGEPRRSLRGFDLGDAFGSFVSGAIVFFLCIVAAAILNLPLFAALAILTWPITTCAIEAVRLLRVPVRVHATVPKHWYAKSKHHKTLSAGPFEEL